MAQSLVNDANQSGSLPRWALANASTGEMTGDNGVPLIASLYAFGAKDVRRALYYMANGATDSGVGRDGCVERPGIASYLEHGYAPQTEEFRGDHGIEGASITLEWSVDDFAISQFADALDENMISAEFLRRAQFWQNLFNPATRRITPRGADGAFLVWPGFTGPTSDLGEDGFNEGNSEQDLWMVPQNIVGLVATLGGREALAERLDRFTTELNAGPHEPYLLVGNEPPTSPVRPARRHPAAGLANRMASQFRGFAECFRAPARACIRPTVVHVTIDAIPDGIPVHCPPSARPVDLNRHSLKRRRYMIDCRTTGSSLLSPDGDLCWRRVGCPTRLACAWKTDRLRLA
ncbi:hypothetical protein AWB95_01385 [Mycobacterium celatum]|uniref:Glycosyl hydrolase family 92 domain-containing protein n=1 Tax=Mycobacterium celatum TaxID=28045 RepID=A0A1X1RWU9_MYCCE|nr:glycoside hydrolase domain-containing protein [Mycobacterium celatum]ORV19461.1 hypothetical protein AWB95_01385 [Mycobacterium celatum]